MLKRVDNDNLYAMNNEIMNFIGSLIMWFSLCQLYSGFDMHVYNNRYEVELGYINCLVAGGGGGLFALFLKKILDCKYWQKQKIVRDKRKSVKNPYDYGTQFANPLSRYDVFVMGRGIIAGCIMVSAPGIYYKIWISFILGCIGGLIYVLACFMTQMFKIDDPMHIFQTHGLPAVFSLIFIVVFHDKDGIFFTNSDQITSKEQLSKIIQIFGANSLGCLLIICWCAVLTVPTIAILKACCLRVTKVTEFIGLDVA